ncbi:halocyanin domain-containing protein [Halomicrobium zhouii]|uniref:Halocyanin domain-containing protein n=1 Tax=Halomicrobium zhouii TaxID=767519 RepID=A0A1I6LJP8_9EURY|nr:halocyanin domain-containing protein [Halomicrobium zhouii]SFS03542.1 halocyanin domain-containing protein [Halomicrobium zhouii]
MTRERARLSIDRRTVLRATGAVGLGGLVGMAGCAEGGDGGDGGDGDGGGGSGGTETIAGSDYPAVDEWLTETDVGGADDTYDGSIVDWREESEPTVDVGAEGNDGYYAFGPSAIAVSAGTEVRWEWTGEGETHNVEAEPEEQIGESDYEFSSGDPVAEAGTEYTYTFDEAGVALYHCEPHLALGMKGAVVVE